MSQNTIASASNQGPYGLRLLASIDLLINGLRESGSHHGTSKFAFLTLSSADKTRVNECSSALLAFAEMDKGGKALITSKKRLVPGFDPASSILLRDVAAHVFYYMRGWLEVLFDFDPKLPDLFSRKEFCKTWKRLMDIKITSFVAQAKYFVVYPMARFLKNPLPPKPVDLAGGPLIFTGAVKRYLKNRITSLNNKNAGLMQGILQGVKRATKIVPESFIDSALEKHRRTMIRENTVNPKFTKDFGLCSTILASSFSSKERIFEASPSASMERGRSTGGQRSTVLSALSDSMSEQKSVEKNDLRGDNYYTESLSSNLIKMTLHHQNQVETVSRPSHPPSLEDTLNTIFRTKSDEHERSLTGAIRWDTDQSKLNEIFWRNTFNFERLSKVDWFELPSDEEWPLERRLTAKVSAVLEPLKVRLITKGESLPYYLSKFFQKDMWSHIRQFDPFKLVGQKLEIPLLDKLWRKTRQKFLGKDFFQFWVSGDYSAATDGVKTQYSRVSFESLLDRTAFPSQIKNLLRSVLYEHEIHYPSPLSGGEQLKPAFQRTGQLMGSPMSFPILCWINFIAYWISMSRYLGRPLEGKGSIPFWKLPVYINGDDILFPSNQEHYSIWLTCISEVGFELSLGKNYCSPRYLTVNSELYSFSESKQEFVYIKYLNAGLLTGQSKLNSARENTQRKPLWAQQKIVVEGSYSPVRTYHRFVHYNLKEIETLTNNGEFNVFAHQMLGGLGFKIPEGLTPRFTSWQYKVALFLRNYLTQNVEGRKIRTTHFWKGIVAKSSRLTEKSSNKYRIIQPMLGQGPLNREEEVYEEPTSIEQMLTGFYDTEKPLWEVKMLPQNIVRAIRARYPKPLPRSPSLKKMIEFDYRFIEVPSEFQVSLSIEWEGWKETMAARTQRLKLGRERLRLLKGIDYFNPSIGWTDKPIGKRIHSIRVGL